MNDSKVAPVEAQAVPDLHQQIMNLPCIPPDDIEGTGRIEAIYRIGHCDARHAAAQLVAASPPAAGVREQSHKADAKPVKVSADDARLFAAAPASNAGDNSNALAADVALQWLDTNRSRLHAPACSVHEPSPQCSCGLHKALACVRAIKNGNAHLVIASADVAV